MQDLVQSILESSASRHEQQGGDFLPILAQQTVDDLGLARLVLWSNTSGENSKLIQHGPDIEDEGPEAVDAAPLGGVRIHGRHGIERASGTSNSGRRLLSAALLTGNYRITLDITEGTIELDSDTVSSMTEVYADVQRRRILEQHLDNNLTSRGIEALVIQLHSCRDSEEVANTLATDAASLLKAQRIAVCEKSNRTWRLVATTGVSMPNTRSDASREFCERVKQAESGVAPGSDEGRGCMIVPLHSTQQWEQTHWAGVFEFDQDRNVNADENFKKVCAHAALAFDQCQRVIEQSHSNRLRRRLSRIIRPAFSSVALIFIAAVLALTLIPTDLTIEVYGELTPKNRLHVFAPEDGVVEEIMVEDGTEVSEGQTLCILVNEELNIQLTSVEGELAAANARLSAIDALRGDRSSQVSMALLSSEQAELKVKRESLTTQENLLKRRIASLQIESQLGGRVHGDRLKQSLFRRPLLRGQYLFEVADLAAGWELDLQIPESDVRHVLKAIEGSNQPLKVRYALETTPESFHETSLGRLSSAVNVNEQGLLTTTAQATVENSQHSNERPGAGVVAFIHCGRRSVGFVWFRKLIEFIQRETAF